MRATAGRLEHLALDAIGSLPGLEALGGAPGAFTGAAEVDEEQEEGDPCEDNAQRPARRVAREDPEEPADHRRPRRQSSSRA